MPSTTVILTGLSSFVLRAVAYIFFKWIPGHHGPPTILTALVVYLTCVFGRSSAFGSDRPTLREAFPRLFRHEKSVKATTDATDDEDHDEPAFYHEEKEFLKTVVLGIPDWKEIEFSYITIGINVLLAILAVDFVLRGPLLHSADDLRFSRVGFVDSTSAKILFREPDSSQLPIYIYYKPVQEASWTSYDRVYHLDADTDFTYPLTITKLKPETLYEYSISNNLSGTFTTVPSPGSPRSNALTFLTSSCIKANFPYRPLSHSLAFHGFESLSKIIQNLRSPASFMMFLGDFIYVDVPWRLSSTIKHYRSEYRRVYASPSWLLPGISSVPWIQTLDDHEIANDYHGGFKTELFQSASDPFVLYHSSLNPPVPSSAPNHPETNTTYFQFTQGPASFFMLDTRRYRTDPEPKSSSGSVVSDTSKPLYGSSAETTSDVNHNPPPTGQQHSMLGPAQLRCLLEFLSAPEPAHVHWKIIASSVPFTKNWRFGTPDTWGGYLVERSQILEAMHDAESTLGVRVIILSGDRHEFAAIRFPPPVATFQDQTPSQNLGSSPIPAHPLSPISELHPKSPPAQNQRTVYDRHPQSGPHEFSAGPLSMFYLPIRTFKQIDSEDVSIKYLPDGNSKVGVVDIENFSGKNTEQKSLLRYTLYVDGEVAWEYALTSPAPGYLEGNRRGVRSKIGGKQSASIGAYYKAWSEGIWS